MEISTDVLCAEAPLQLDFTGGMDQSTAQSQLSFQGTPIVIMDHSERLSEQEFVNAFYEGVIRRVDNASLDVKRFGR